MSQKIRQQTGDKEKSEYFYVYICDDWWVGWLPVRIKED